MARNTFHTLFLSLTLLAGFAQGNFIAGKRDTLERRDCDPGATLCGTSGLLEYCADPGWKCCDTRRSAPLSATCCPGGSYAPAGNYCCTDGRNCPIGVTCRGCTPADGSEGFVGSTISEPAAPTTTRAPVVETSTLIIPTYTYYTFTITYFYYQLYYVYVPSITRSTTTSSAVTTTTTITVYASNSADAQESFSKISVTAALPTPSSATFLPPLPSQTSTIASASSTTSHSTPSITPNRTTIGSPAPSQFTGTANRLLADGSSYNSFVGWLILLGVSIVGLCVNLVL